LILSSIGLLLLLAGARIRKSRTQA
jgi:hypothetical protein